MQVILNHNRILYLSMGTVVDMMIPTEQFALSETFDEIPDVQARTVRVAAHGPHGVMPFLRLWSSHPEKLDDALRNDSSTKDVVCVSRDGKWSLYRVSWQPHVQTVIGIFIQTDGSLLAAQGETNQWKLRVLFPDQASVSETYNRWRSHGVDSSIKRVSGVSDTVNYTGIEISSCQHETLLEAFRTDYYDVPRGITLDGLAQELDVSHQALSERLRRGHRNLIATTLCESPPIIK